MDGAFGSWPTDHAGRRYRGSGSVVSFRHQQQHAFVRWTGLVCGFVAFNEAEMSLCM
jgi:hypothetical protein